MQRKTIEGICLGKRLIIRSLSWRRYVAARLLSTSRPSAQNHYDVLGLQRDCSATDIKDSFIRLSKEVHPDKNLDCPDVHQKFIVLNEAYSVLGKPNERRVYDAELKYQEQSEMHIYNGVRTNAPRERVIFKDDSLWEMRDRSQDKKYEGRHYYGVPGIEKRLPNSYIAFGAIIFMLVGGVFHFFIANKSSAFVTEQLDRRDAESRMILKTVRQQALANGNELQMAILQQKSDASNRGK